MFDPTLLMEFATLLNELTTWFVAEFGDAPVIFGIDGIGTAPFVKKDKIE
jgi:hypothetical protein